MFKYAMQIAYEGTAYSGWQRQNDAISIQACLEKALSTRLQKPITVVGSGRTDAGVHAEEQVAHFIVDSEINLTNLVGAINSLLPKDICIFNVVEVPFDFHSQKSVESKEYHYNIWTDYVMPPFVRRYRYHLRRKVNYDLLNAAVNKCIGLKDFASFTNVGSVSKSTIRNLFRLDVVKQTGGIKLEFEGNGFLYKMVRNLTGTVLEIATNQISLDSLDTIFEAKNRTAAPKTAPPQGLFLIKAKYLPKYESLFKK